MILIISLSLGPKQVLENDTSEKMNAMDSDVFANTIRVETLLFFLSVRYIPIVTDNDQSFQPFCFSLPLFWERMTHCNR